MKESITVRIDDRALRGLFREFPKISNSEMNRLYKSVAGDFMRDFSKKRLIRGVFFPKRKGNFPSRKGQPFVPKKARMAGFISNLGGRGAIKGKYVEIRNSNPLILMREKRSASDRVVRPGKKAKPDKKGKKWLYIHSPAGSKYAFGSKKRKGRLGGGGSHHKWKKKQENYTGNWGTHPITAKLERAPKTGSFPHLGFRSSWHAYRSRLPSYYRKGAERIAQRAQRFIDKRRAA